MTRFAIDKIVREITFFIYQIKGKNSFSDAISERFRHRASQRLILLQKTINGKLQNSKKVSRDKKVKITEFRNFSDICCSVFFVQIQFVCRLIDDN